MNYDHPKSQRLVFGMSGTGKTTLWLKLLAGSPARWKFAFDHKLEVSRKLGWQAASTPEGLCWQFEHGKPIVFFPGRMFPDDLDQAFDVFCRFVWNLSARVNGTKLLAADELQDFTGISFKSLPASFRNIVNNGRYQEIDLLLAAQSLNDVNCRVRRQVTELYVFKHSDVDNTTFSRMKESGIDPEAVKALPYPDIDKKVGWIYRNALTGRSERVIHAIDRAGN